MVLIIPGSWFDTIICNSILTLIWYWEPHIFKFHSPAQYKRSLGPSPSELTCSPRSLRQALQFILACLRGAKCWKGCWLRRGSVVGEGSQSPEQADSLRVEAGS